MNCQPGVSNELLVAVSPASSELSIQAFATLDQRTSKGSGAIVSGTVIALFSLWGGDFVRPGIRVSLGLGFRSEMWSVEAHRELAALRKAACLDDLALRDGIGGV